jgi:16S rRNA (guanine1207-N2)-methyltransferase
MRRSKRHAKSPANLVATLASKLRPPFGIALGSPREVAELVANLPEGGITCFQMDLHQADRLSDNLRDAGRPVEIQTTPDLWDLSASVQTLIYPVPYGGERALKLDMIEQGYHILKPQGTMVVVSPYEKEDFFATALKKVFGKIHIPMEGDNQVFWCTRAEDRPRRRHEMTYHVRVDETASLVFASRPGVFGYGFYDDGARALMEAVELYEGQRVLDLGCGNGTNGVLAARRVGQDAFVMFVDSNVRAIALAELNAKSNGVTQFQAIASHTLAEIPPESFDAVLANPPYYAQGFIEHGKAALKSGGVLYLVTKQIDAAFPMMQEHFPQAEAFENRGYFIFRAPK